MRIGVAPALVLLVGLAVMVCGMPSKIIPTKPAKTLLERIQNKYEVVRVDMSDIYFKHPVKAGKVLFNENSLHAHGVKAAHPTTATFRFKAYGKDYSVNLEKNTELFSPRYVQMGLNYDEKGNYLGRVVDYEHGMPEEDNCWYNGYVANDPDEPQVVIDTCAGGFRGLVVGHGESLGIEPAAQHLSMAEQKLHAQRLFGAEVDPASVDMHLVYRLKDEVLSRAFRCSVGSEHTHGSHKTEGVDDAHDHEHDGHDGHEHEHEPRNQTMADLFPASGAPRRQLLQGTPIKYIELMLVNDHQRLVYSRTTPSWDVIADAVNIATRVAYLYGTPPDSGQFLFNGAAAVFRPILVGMTSFLNNDPYTMTLSAAGEVSVSSLLPAFNSWRSNPANLIVSPATPGCPNHDNGQLLSGFNFDGTTLGYAGVGVMCNFASSGGIDQTYNERNNPGLHGAILAHELGHNFGMQHDGASGAFGNTCPISGFIMNSAASITNPPTVFSGCSVRYLNTFMASLYTNGGGRTCLDNTPTVVFNTSGVCGDGFVDPGEDCDCGASDCQSVSSTDRCCTARTCRFRTDITPAAKCRASDGCCIAATCQPRPASANYTCRAAANACDLPEMCTGSGACPTDIYKGAGTACTTATDGAGMCYKAQCVSANQVCRLQGATLTGAPWQASPDAASCQPDGNPCGVLYCSSVSNPAYQGCFAFQSSSATSAQVPNGVPCGTYDQCKSGRCVPSAQLNDEFYYAPGAWESCDACNTVQRRSATCVTFSTSLPSTDTRPCSTPSGLPALEQLCRNDTLGCVYAADIGNDNVSLFGQTVAKNTLMFAVLGMSALVLVTLACCYQAVTFGNEKEEPSPENSQVDGDPEWEDAPPNKH